MLLGPGGRPAGARLFCWAGYRTSSRLTQTSGTAPPPPTPRFLRSAAHTEGMRRNATTIWSLRANRPGVRAWNPGWKIEGPRSSNDFENWADNRARRVRGRGSTAHAAEGGAAETRGVSGVFGRRARDPLSRLEVREFFNNPLTSRPGCYHVNNRANLARVRPSEPRNRDKQPGRLVKRLFKKLAPLVLETEG